MAQSRDAERRRSKKMKKPANPLVKGIVVFCERKGVTVSNLASPRKSSAVASEAGRKSPKENSISSELTTNSQTRDPSLPYLSILDIPKRYTLYSPLLLLPVNFALYQPRWTDFYSGLCEKEKAELFKCIAEEGFTGMDVSRIAVNAPISAEAENEVGSMNEKGEGKSLQHNDKAKRENVLRSPLGLDPVYGDWGPIDDDDHKHRRRTSWPTEQDFNEAFWASTSQHQRITQCWAPLYTMFSRGNISEKARILGLLQSTFPGLEEKELHEEIPGVDVVDFYVGIGYFAFCYLQRGVRRVFGWDINPWSIEGLRRGCEINGWGCLVVRVGDMGEVLDGSVTEVAERIAQGNEIRCVAFLGDNQWAAKALREVQFEIQRAERGENTLNIRHVNLGLLPTSRKSWEDAVALILGLNRSGGGGWMHVHENVDIRQIDVIQRDIVMQIDGLVRLESEKKGGHRAMWSTSCAHVEQVKAFAPGVVHCVFDIEIKRKC